MYRTSAPQLFVIASVSEAIQICYRNARLLRRFAPRNDDE
jgi:hypothetical protein